MIVKNEEPVLRRCLDCVAQFADELIVVDTGSTDRSMEIVREYTPHVYLHPWQNSFAEARNYLESNIEGVREMSKSKEELNKIKEEVEAVNEKLQELTPEEIAQISGGKPFVPPPVPVEQ